jgi:hypothetical protein
MLKFKTPAPHLGASGIHSVGYGQDRGVIWPTGIRPDGMPLQKHEEIISSNEYFSRISKGDRS